MSPDEELELETAAQSDDQPGEQLTEAQAVSDASSGTAGTPAASGNQSPPPAQKSLTIDQLAETVWSGLRVMFTPPAEAEPEIPLYPHDFHIETMLTDRVIVTIYLDQSPWNASYSIPYTMNGDQVVFASREQWEKVQREWVAAKRLENTAVYLPNSDSSIKTAVSGHIGTVEGMLIRFSDPDDPDLTGDYFDAETDYGPHTKSIVYYDHGLDEIVGVKRLGASVQSSATLKMTDVGVWVQAQLDLRDEYEAAVFGLAQKGKMGWSSGTASHLFKKTPVKNSRGAIVNRITHWPLGIDATLTPTPAEFRNEAKALTGKAISLKTYHEVTAARPNLKALSQASRSDASADATGEVKRHDQKPLKSGGNGRQSHTQLEEIDMPPEELEKLLKQVADQAATSAAKTFADGLQAEVGALKTAVATITDAPATNGVGHDTPAADETQDDARKNLNTFYQMRFGNEDDALRQVKKEVVGGEYRQVVLDQTRAFTKFVRLGDGRLNTQERELLDTQIFPDEAIKTLVKQDHSVKSMKDMMVAAQGDLGGFAVPPPMQASISARLPGLTAVRGGGATVVNLINGNSVPVPQYDGGNDRYVGALRGEWGSEGQAPGEQNAKLKEVSVEANIYTYKIRMSMTLVQDAANLLQIVEDDIVNTLSIDEDEGFLIGNGVGKPLGWLPGGANTLVLKEVISGAAATLTTAGVRKLKRGVASQYRARGSFVGNSDTYGDIENLTISGTGSDLAFPSLADNGLLLRQAARESEAMPDVAAGAFPLLFADMAAYWIVEKFGLTVARFQDSGTGINRVELQVRKRVGGRPVELWRAAVQKVAAP